MADRQESVVVGAGIAGLASALALARAGWHVTVLERAPALGEVGAGLALTANGMTALDALGLGDAVRAAGYPTASAGYQDQAGRWLLRIPQASPRVRAITALCGLHRRRLHGVLSAAAAAHAAIDLVTGAQVTGVTPGVPGGERASVTCAAGSLGADLVVAADGVRSVIRGQLFPAVRPRYSGNTSWRAVIPDASAAPLFVSVLGPGAEFGALRVSDTELYWYGYAGSPEGIAYADELAEARARFGSWPPWVRDLLAATTADRLMRHDVYDLPDGPPSYVSGRVVLAGDAAHAMQPTVGQGASAALEDGVCAGRLIAAPARSGGDLAAGLAAYDKGRRPRCRQFVRTANLLARLGPDVGPGWRQAARNALLRRTPAGLAVRAGAGITRWSPP